MACRRLFLLSVGLATLMVHSLPPVYWSRFSCLCSPEQVCWWHHQIGSIPLSVRPWSRLPSKDRDRLLVLPDLPCCPRYCGHPWYICSHSLVHDTSVPTVSFMIHLFPQSRSWYICSHSLVDSALFKFTQKQKCPIIYSPTCLLDSVLLLHNWGVSQKIKRREHFTIFQWMITLIWGFKVVVLTDFCR